MGLFLLFLHCIHQASWLSIFLRFSHLSLLSSSGIAGTTGPVLHIWLLCAFWGFELRSLCLRTFNCWVISLGLYLSFFFFLLFFLSFQIALEACYRDKDIYPRMPYVNLPYLNEHSLIGVPLRKDQESSPLHRIKWWPLVIRWRFPSWEKESSGAALKCRHVE